MEPRSARNVKERKIEKNQRAFVKNIKEIFLQRKEPVQDVRIIKREGKRSLSKDLRILLFKSDYLY